ncbi:MAG: hypothetical protein ACK4WH_02965 [Phycisphaerales bacterium]
MTKQEKAKWRAVVRVLRQRPTVSLATLVWYALLLTCVIYPEFVVHAGATTILHMFAFIIGVSLGMVPLIFLIRAIEFEMRRLKQAEGRLCGWCGYDLSGLTEVGDPSTTCPECGRMS